MCCSTDDGEVHGGSLGPGDDRCASACGVSEVGLVAFAGELRSTGGERGCHRVVDLARGLFQYELVVF
jgi:hypothetical protein